MKHKKKQGRGNGATALGIFSIWRSTTPLLVNEKTKIYSEHMQTEKLHDSHPHNVGHELTRSGPLTLWRWKIVNLCEDEERTYEG